MSSVAPTSASAAAGLAGGTSSPLPSKELGKDEFLRLLTTQLSNQDPLKPVDNQAFIAQLAQFASVEQLHKVSSGLESLLVSQTSQTQLSTAGLVGRRVVYATDAVTLAAPGQAASLQASTASAAQLTALVRDAAGRVVRTLPLGAKAPGTFAVEWDGRDDAGNAAPAGAYSVTVAGRDAAGAPVAATTRAAGTVTGAAFGDGGAQLLVNGARVKLSDVVEIYQAS